MKDLTTGNEGTAIFNFALPMLIGSLFQQLYNTADSIIVGRFIGKEAMAAVAGANPIMFLLSSLLIGMTLGFSILISQYYGAKDYEKVKATIDTTYLFIFGASMIITVVGVVFCGPILKLMNTPSDIFTASKEYLIIIFAGTIFSAGYNSISAILRGLGDSITPLYFLVVATIINIILDIVFIVNFGMGTNGVAMATIIAQACAFLFSLLFLSKRNELLKVRFKGMIFNRWIFKQGLTLGIPSGIQQMLFSIGNIALQVLVNGFGTAAMAAFGAGSRIESFISIPIMNLGAAVSTFVAQNIGAKKIARAEKGVRISIYMALVLAITVTLVFMIFSRELIMLFNTDEEVVQIGAQYLRTIGPFFFLICISFMLTSAIRGAGDAMFSLISSVITLWLARIPASYLLSHYFSERGIWMGIPVGWVIGFFITVVYYKSGRWKRKRMVS